MLDIALKRFQVNYNAIKNEPTLVFGLGGYYNKKPLIRVNEETNQVEKIMSVLK
jgi:hypothetical protein